MDLSKRKTFLLLLGASSVVLLVLANVVGFETTHQVYLVAAHFHNNSLSYLTSLNLSIISKDKEVLRHSVVRKTLADLEIHSRNPNTNININVPMVTRTNIRYNNSHIRSKLHSSELNGVNNDLRSDLVMTISDSDVNNALNIDKHKHSTVAMLNNRVPDSYNGLSTKNKSTIQRKRLLRNNQIFDNRHTVHSKTITNEEQPHESVSAIDTLIVKHRTRPKDISNPTLTNVSHDSPFSKYIHGINDDTVTPVREQTDDVNHQNMHNVAKEVIQTVDIDDENIHQSNDREHKDTNQQSMNTMKYESVIRQGDYNNDNEMKNAADESSIKQCNESNEINASTIPIETAKERKSYEPVVSMIDQHAQRNSENNQNVPNVNALQVSYEIPALNENKANIQTDREAGVLADDRSGIKFAVLVGNLGNRVDTQNAQTTGTNKSAASRGNEGYITDPSCPIRNMAVEDILCMKRPQFLPDFRNPCWYQNGTLRCMPYFHIIGVCKTGTTDLFERLAHHPQIIKNTGILGKETWYWSWLRYGHSHFYRVSRREMLLKNFVDKFDARAIKQFTKRLENGSVYHPAVTGHGDPMDFWDLSSWKLIPQNDPTADVPVVTTPSLIKHVNPNVKLILLVRDPIERLFSNYLHGQFGKTSTQFHEDVLSSVSLLKSCTRSRSMRSCLYDSDIIRNLRVPISGSFYSIHLPEWLKVFPREQLLITRTEHFSTNIANTLLRIFRFLKLDPLPTKTLYRIANMPHFYNTKAKLTSGEIIDETRTVLSSLFEPYNNDLATMLGDQSFNYNNT